MKCLEMKCKHVITELSDSGSRVVNRQRGHERGRGGLINWKAQLLMWLPSIRFNEVQTEGKHKQLESGKCD